MTKQELKRKFREDRYNLSTRAKNILRYLGIYAFDDFYQSYFTHGKVPDFGFIRTCGKKTADELRMFEKLILKEIKNTMPNNKPLRPINHNNRIELIFDERFDGLSRRTKNVLGRARAANYRSFCEKILKAESPANYILKLENCGVKTQKEILKFKDVIEEMAYDDEWLKISEGIFADISFSFFETKLFSQRELVVLRNYYGVEQNQFSKNLTDLSVELGLTRERVRQISIEVLKKIKRNIRSILKVSTHEINDYFEQDFFEVDEAVAAQINDSETTNFSSSFITLAMEIFCVDGFSFISTGSTKLPDYDGIFIRNNLPFDFKKCLNDLSIMKDKRRPDDFIMEIDELLIPSIQYKKLSLFQSDNSINLIDRMQILGALKLLTKKIEDEKNKIEVTSESIILKRNTKKLKYEYLVDILRDFRRPMHFSELENECQRRGIKIKSVQGALMHHPEIFGLKGQGTYGLIEWGGYFGSIGDVTEQLLIERNVPIKRRELEDILCRELYISQDSIREVLFNYAPEDRFVKRENDCIALKIWD